MIQQMLAIWSLVPLPFLNPVWTSGSSWFTYCWSLAWRILNIPLLACEMSAIVRYFEHSLALPFFGTGMKTDLFQSCGYWWVFQICWHIECSTFIASSFRIWNSSTEIPTPPLSKFLRSKCFYLFVCWYFLSFTKTESFHLQTIVSFLFDFYTLFFIRA